MKINFEPKSNLGKWSISLIIVAPILFYIGMSFIGFYESVSAGKTIFNDIIARPGLAISMLGGFFSGIFAFLCGILGIMRKKDHSVFVFISTVSGFFVLLWVIIEILFPH
ncbi:MAG: hypothetical protein PHP37_00795 [Patescibacteria group bacterium]|nr:hypothetical protein [Patescibacteria group bacterium]